MRLSSQASLHSDHTLRSPLPITSWAMLWTIFDFEKAQEALDKMQKPHPPLWMACSQLPTIERAGQNGFWSARLPVRQRRCRPCLGARLLQRDHQAAEKARRLRDQSEHGAGVVLHVREDRRGGPRARRWRDVLPVRATLLRRLAEPAASGAGHCQHVG